MSRRPALKPGLPRRDLWGCNVKMRILLEARNMSLAHSSLLLRPATHAGTEIRIRPCRQR